MIIFRKGIIKNQGKIKILRYVKRGMPEGKQGYLDVLFTARLK